MKIAPDRLAALIKDHQAHAVLISEMAAGSNNQQPATESEIVAAIQAADAKGVVAERDALKQEVANLKATNAAALAAKDTELAGVRAELAKAKSDLDLAKPKGVKPLDGNPPADPPKPSAIAAYEAKKAELIKAGDKTPTDTIARKFPDINQAFIEATNAKTKKEA